jgi:hypothetical protein
MNGYRVPEYIRKGQYRIVTQEEMEAHYQEGENRDAAVKLLTILMTVDQPLTADEVLGRVRAWCNTKKGKSFYFYWGQESFEEYLDSLVRVYFFLERIEDKAKNVVKYQASPHGLNKLQEYKEWLERYLDQTFEEIQRSFSHTKKSKKPSQKPYK